MAKRLQKRRAKVNVPICVAGILLCLTLFSVHLTSGIYARYTTTASGSDSARVISFGDITLTKIGEVNQYIAPGVEMTLNASVTFDGSESATYVFMEVTPTGCMTVSDGLTYMLAASGATWTVDTTVGDDKPAWNYLKKDGNAYVYYISLQPNQALTGRLLFKESTTNISEGITAEAIASLGTGSAEFRASVVQSIGFDSVEAAWNSVKAH